MPTGTSIVVSTSPATMSFGNQARRYSFSTCKPRSHRPKPVEGSGVVVFMRRGGAGCELPTARSPRANLQPREQSFQEGDGYVTRHGGHQRDGRHTLSASFTSDA